MNDERQSPETSGGISVDRWLKLAEAAAVLGLTERQAREWVRARALPVTTGRPARVAASALLAAMRQAGKVPRPLPEISPEVSGDAPGESPEISGSHREPIEAAYRVTPAEVEQAIERTAGRYVADFVGLYDRISTEVAERYEQTIAAKDETIATQADALAELRRRAEVAEAQRDALRSQAVPQPSSEAPTIVVMTETPEAHQPAGGFWAWVRRALGGE